MQEQESNTNHYDVLALGNAIVDIVVEVDDTFIQTHELTKGSMTLIDESKALELYQAMPQGKQVSGGSAANTIAGVASFGGKAAFIGKVNQDELGMFFQKDLQELGVTSHTKPTEKGPRTAFSLIFVTPDAQRTMATFLGATTKITPADIDIDLVKQSAILYIEGYLWDQPAAIDAILKAIHQAHIQGKKTSFTLSDVFCVDRHRDAFLELLQHIDILFANEEEAKALYQTTSLDEAIENLQGKCEITAITRSEKGSVILTDTVTTIDIDPVANVIDTTGAGDMYAAGFLYALSQGYSIQQCGKYGSIAAASIIQHLGARPRQSLAELAKLAA